MKKLLCTICTVLCMCVLLCACGQTEPSVGDLMYEKYGGIIDKLEAEDYEGALEDVQAMMPEPEIIEVRITPENFFDYYEIGFKDRSFVEKDAEGKILHLYPSIQESFVLKSEYVDRLIDEDEVEVGYTGDLAVKKMNIDWSTGVASLGDETYPNILQEYVDIENYERDLEHLDDIVTVISKTVSSIKNDYGYSSFEDINGEHSALIKQQYNPYFGRSVWWHVYNDITPEDDLYYLIVDNIQIVRAEGVLHLHS